MMPSLKDNLYIIRMRGSISSVTPRWWESNTFCLSSTRYALLCFFLKEVKVPWNVCLLKCFTNMLWNADIWWSFSTVKFMKVSFQESTQESGVGRCTRKEQVTGLIKNNAATVSPGPMEACFYQDTCFFFFSYSSQFQSWKNQRHCQKSRVVRLWGNHICWTVLRWKATKNLCFLW